MRRSLLLLSVLAALATGSVQAGPVPEYIGRRVSTPQDMAAIKKVVEEFKAAIKARDTRALSALLLHGDILFASPASPEAVRRARANVNVHSDGMPAGGFDSFARFLTSAKGPVEERFFNVKIIQDGHLAWVMFDYDFLVNEKPVNYGVESWQMIKNAEGEWKIVTVLWSMKPAPAPKQ